MIKKAVITVSLIIFVSLLFVVVGCSHIKYDVEPDSTRSYHSIDMKVNIKNKETGKKGSFKILLKYDEQLDKMMFLSPINQVMGILAIKVESSILVNTKRKKYWEGEFNTLLKELWGIDIEYGDFKRMLSDGFVPEEKVKERNIQVEIEKDPEGKRPVRVVIETEEMRVQLKITKRETLPGRLRPFVDLKGMKQAGIRELMD